MHSDTNTAPIGSADDLALDAATKGRKGTARAGFHTAYRAERFTTPTGTPGRRNIAARCTCTAKANHA